MNIINWLKQQDIFESIYLEIQSFNNRRKMSLSQVGQDFWVFGEVFNEKYNGYFVEIGAADGIMISNTFLLEKKYCWGGLCIEANPLFFEKLKRVRKATCLNVCLDNQEGEVDFVLKHVLGGIIDSDTDNKPESINSEKTNVMTVKTKTLVSVLREQKAPHIIDYLSIDVEGAEARILCDFPFSEYQFNCLTIERPQAKLREVLKQNGYILVKEMPNLDAFYIHESFLADYHRNMFLFWCKKNGVSPQFYSQL